MLVIIGHGVKATMNYRGTYKINNEFHWKLPLSILLRVSQFSIYKLTLIHPRIAGLLTGGNLPRPISKCTLGISNIFKKVLNNFQVKREETKWPNNDTFKFLLYLHCMWKLIKSSDCIVYLLSEKVILFLCVSYIFSNLS